LRQGCCVKLRMWLVWVLVGAGLTSCTDVAAIRTQPPSSDQRVLSRPRLSPPNAADERTGSASTDENHRIIEEYPDYFIGFAEFDDQGWAYSNVNQLDIIRDRIAADLANPAYEKQDFLVLVFVHGWHHNARDNDSNVQQFRQMVDIAANGLEKSVDSGVLKTHRRVIGIYVGWRGESVDAPLLRYLTVFDRRNAAERVAQGAVRQLFANIRLQQLQAQDAFGDGCPKSARMRTVVIGHSFGGLIAFNALGQAELNELTLEQRVTQTPCTADDEGRVRGSRLPSLWPDAMILINPAFEASRYESFDRLMKSAPPPKSAANAETASSAGVVSAPNSLTPAWQQLAVPRFIVVASATDHWTGGAFTKGRRATTLFEKYARFPPEQTQAEREANLHSIAYVNAYRTHTLDLPVDQPDAKAVARLVPVLAGKAPMNSPVWVVMASNAVVNGHNGFLYGPGKKNSGPGLYLANWLLQLYDMDCTAAPEMARCPQ
jgi:pimeloyl-ACP methyl ester carboxylesterase